MVICPLFGKAFVVVCCLVVLVLKLDNVRAYTSIFESFGIDYIPDEGASSSSQYTNDLKKTSLKFRKSQGREHEVKIYKKGCAEDITNDSTYIMNVHSSGESLVPNTNNNKVDFDIEITFQNNIQNTNMSTIVNEDFAKIEVCVRVDVLYVNPKDPADKLSVNFREVELLWSIRLDAIGVFHMDVSLRDDKKFDEEL
mmetsp:Transcript_3834/g.5608  ORF Transcript_3834/g.5608 Transcript_3834/m.5608 type:complete len:197 (+) Transcript_3834:276-866(+)